jgi:L-asparaginase
VVLTGGTIGSRHEGDKITMSARQARAQELIDLVERAQGDRRDRFAGVKVRQPVWLDSTELVPRDWLKISAAIRSLVHRHGATAVLVAHGTDTMAYSAAALSFLCLDLDVPICLTGAVAPIDAPRSDAVDNVIHSVQALRQLRAGVYVSFAGAAGRPGRLHLGSRVRKVSGADGVYVSVNSSPLATIDRDGLHMHDREPERFQVPSQPVLEPRVMGLTLHPGLDLRAMLKAVEAAEIAGVVVERYPSGAAPSTRSGSLPAFARALRRLGVTCVALREPPRPPGAPDYPLVAELQEEGAIVLDGMSREAAITKLMWVLAQGWSDARVREVFSWSLCGERALATDPR